MTVRNHIEQALRRVDAEQDAVEAKLKAFDTFITEISDLPTESRPSTSPGVTATASARLRDDSSTDERCRAVRRVFDETIQPHSVADIDESEPLLATIQNELTDSIAVALAPATETSFSQKLKRMIVAEANTQRAGVEAMSQALKKEVIQLEDANEIATEITAWISETNEISLVNLGFEALQHRHETLADHRNLCEKLAHRRQKFIKKPQIRISMLKFSTGGLFYTSIRNSQIIIRY